MTRQLLVFLALAFLLLTAAWVAHIVMLSNFAPLMHPPMTRGAFIAYALLHGEGSPFPTLKPFFVPVAGLFCIVAVLDQWITRRDRELVSSFAEHLKLAPEPERGVQQQWRANSLLTTCFGRYAGRQVSIALCNLISGRTAAAELNVDLECACPWTLEIRKRSFVTTLLAEMGAELKTGDAELDRITVIQADDTEAVLAWLRNADVRNRVIDLIQDKGADLIAARQTDDGRVLRLNYQLRGKRGLILANAGGALGELSSLAASAEHARI